MEQGSFSSQEELQREVDRMIDESDALAFQALSRILEEVRHEQ